MASATEPRGSTVITVANQKGGVGKTTTVMNVGIGLARKGFRVLLVDSDPQANLTSYLGVIPGHAPHEDIRTLDEVFLAKRSLGQDTIGSLFVRTASGVDLLASEKSLAGVEYYLFPRPDKESVLSRFLRVSAAAYDYVLIDTPPSLSLLTINALCASDHVLIPVQPEFFGLEGIVKIRETIENVRARWNPRITLLGVLPTQVATRRKLTEEVLEALRGELGQALLATRVHDSSSVTESSGHACSVYDYDRSSRGAKDYAAVTEEIITRLAGARSRRAEGEHAR